jgi:hypothetical protein
MFDARTDKEMSKLSDSEGERNNQGVEARRSDVLALGMTAAIVAFVGAIVVLTIPYAILSVPLPASVNRLGWSVEATQGLLFGHVGYLLIPSILFALWVGFKFYWWGQKVPPKITPDKIAADLANDRESQASAEARH